MGQELRGAWPKVATAPHRLLRGVAVAGVLPQEEAEVQLRALHALVAHRGDVFLDKRDGRVLSDWLEMPRR